MLPTGRCVVRLGHCIAPLIVLILPWSPQIAPKSHGLLFCCNLLFVLRKVKSVMVLIWICNDNNNVVPPQKHFTYDTIFVDWPAFVSFGPRYFCPQFTNVLQHHVKVSVKRSYSG